MLKDLGKVYKKSALREIYYFYQKEEFKFLKGASEDERTAKFVDGESFIIIFGLLNYLLYSYRRRKFNIICYSTCCSDYREAFKGLLNLIMSS